MMCVDILNKKKNQKKDILSRKKRRRMEMLKAMEESREMERPPSNKFENRAQSIVKKKNVR